MVRHEVCQIANAQVLYEASDSLEARQLIDALDAHGIEATVLGEYLGGAAGELPAMNYPWVWLINNDDLHSAQDVLDGFLASRGNLPKARSWVCRTCGAEVDAGFDICWQCGAPRK